MTLVADLNPSVSVPFSRMRQLLEDTALQAGVVGATDLKVAQRGAGANMSVDVPAGQAWVEVTTGTRNGLVHVVSDATANVAVTASNATNPRIDQIVLRYNDTSIPTGSGDVPTLAVLTGTATAGATLDNRTGAATLTADSVRLADILVPATSTSVTTANIRDRRPWARGFFTTLTSPSGAAYSTTSITAVVVDTTNLQARVECSGAPLRVTFSGNAATSANAVRMMVGVDGTFQNPAPIAQVGTTTFTPFNLVMVLALSAGSHLITPYWHVTAAATGQIDRANAGGSNPLPTLIIEEIVKPNTNNGTA